jgi:hypothetical protein
MLSVLPFHAAGMMTAVGFFPGLPVRITFSPGMEHWWDVFWWAFQIATMAYLLIWFRKSADWVDAKFSKKATADGKKTKKPS